jgi:hypothetical protein
MSIKQISEAKALSPANLTGKTWKIRIIEGDRQGSSAYYPKEALESGKHLFAEGTRIFRNHPSANERWDQPERRIEDIIGWLSEDATFDGKDLYANATFIESEQGRIKELAEAGLIGMSIRASGEMVEGKNGMELKCFKAVHSVDVVTQAGAGGAFTKLLESAQVSASESGAESLEEKESTMDPKLEAALDALVEANKANAEAVAKLVERAEKEDIEKAAALAEAERKEKEAQEAKAPSAAEIAGKLVEAELPKAAHAKVIAAVEGGADLEEAIKAEQDYLKTIVEESGKAFAGNGSEEVTESAKPGSTIGKTIFG